MDPDHVAECLGQRYRQWQDFDPSHPMEYVFLDSYFDQQYRQEDRLMSLFTYFSLLTVFIACMGLFGLASFQLTEF